MTLQIVTSNLLSDGHVVYLDGDGAWSNWIESGKTAKTEAAAKKLMGAAELDVVDGVIVDPYLIEVARTGDAISAVEYREHLRANGPSIHPHFGYQAERPEK
jgi:hypothetical protein